MNRIKELRIEKDKTMAQVARDLNIPYTTYVNYEKGVREPSHDMLILLADYFSASVDYLIGRSNNRIDERILDIVNEIDDDILENCNGDLLLAQREQFRRDLLYSEDLPDTNKIPLVGTIACGSPILAQENIEEYVGVPEFVHADFALRCKGDSMINARICDGDIVYIRQQPDCENGEIAAVLIEDEATLKRVYKSKNKLTLMPENSAYEPFIFVGEELNNIRILGKAVYFVSAVR